MEQCPFCRQQLMTCGCRYEKLGLFDAKHGPETGFLPRSTYEDGLSDEQDARWTAILEAKGRVPYAVTRLPRWTGKGTSPASALLELVRRGGEAKLVVLPGVCAVVSKNVAFGLHLRHVPDRTRGRSARLAEPHLAEGLDTSALVATATDAMRAYLAGEDEVVWADVAVLERLQKRRGLEKTPVLRLSFDRALGDAVRALGS